MKLFFVFLLVTTCVCAQVIPPEIALSLKTTTTWQEFPLTYKPLKNQNKKWVWKESITFKSKQAVQLKELCLKWTGKELPALHASLYRKRDQEKLIPVEKNLICDGVWNQRNQELTFHLDEKLIALNTFHLVVNFSQQLEPIIKNGTFSLIKNKSLQLTILS